ncbi:ABC-type cobalamin/Fe3+-siderophores transport systems, ATPase component [Archaeoglobus sulfaticallidus PM70-1]|uniref:ABC-type cobalamin/Fe3+-siderophores transport systems, ATPase component n=1 Tax=Archaeoglobus sulfaticallidus PM70-1 TaxID=387631 RepID=N0BKB7_9EURY|nr:ABC transporter ATP-binding protein [Archaeoglobus sulfaticallidus]AGK60941.1 ABC-type cobalamin/Fe3+-siderophores transport systems, ATPase component [Archaeoglobus sulfaticallidus PM70-1]
MRLKVKGVSVRLGSSEVLRDMTFEVSDHDFVALLGPNGSGKSTLLRTIFGILRPVRGVVLLDGRKIKTIDSASKRMGFLPQETPETGLSVLDIVLLGRTPYLSGIKRASSVDINIALNALKEVGMEDFAQRSFLELSGGEKQKVMLARVFAQQPQIMLLDEPTAHLDISAQIEIMEIVREKVKEGCSALLAIHDINLAASFASRILMVKKGKIIYAGTAEEVITENTIREVFGADVSVKRHGKSVYVVPRKKVRFGNRRVHVICGGGSGKDLLHILSEAGYRISAGVINALDSDWELITEIGGESIDEAPFTPISEESHEQNLKMIENVDAVVLSNLSFGWGNFKNLLASEYAAKLGKLIVVNRTPFKSRNFTDSKAEEIYSRILEKAVVVNSEEEVLDALRKLLG